MWHPLCVTGRNRRIDAERVLAPKTSDNHHRYNFRSGMLARGIGWTYWASRGRKHHWLWFSRRVSRTRCTWCINTISELTKQIVALILTQTAENRSSRCQNKSNSRYRNHSDSRTQKDQRCMVFLLQCLRRRSTEMSRPMHVQVEILITAVEANLPPAAHNSYRLFVNDVRSDRRFLVDSDDRTLRFLLSHMATATVSHNWL